MGNAVKKLAKDSKKLVGLGKQLPEMMKRVGKGDSVIYLAKRKGDTVLNVAKIGGAIIPPETTIDPTKSQTLEWGKTAGMRSTAKPFTTVCRNRHTIRANETIITDGKDLFCPICGSVLHAY